MRAPLRVQFGLALVVLAACSDATAPAPRPTLPSSILFDIAIDCVGTPQPPYTCAPTRTTRTRGDRMTLGEILIDTVANDTAHVVVRPICWQNLSVRRPDGAIDYLPLSSTCRDSTQSQGDNPPQILNLRFYGFPVPDSWTPGTYTVTSLMLVDPPVTITKTFVVN